MRSSFVAFQKCIVSFQQLTMRRMRVHFRIRSKFIINLISRLFQFNSRLCSTVERASVCVCVCRVNVVVDRGYFMRITLLYISYNILLINLHAYVYKWYRINWFFYSDENDAKMRLPRSLRLSLLLLLRMIFYFIPLHVYSHGHANTSNRCSLIMIFHLL